MWIFSRAVPREAAIVTPRAPCNLTSGGYVWFDHDDRASESQSDDFSEAVATLRHFVGSLPTLYPVAHDRIVLIGFSQGAALCQALTLSYPEITIGLASIAGASPVHPVPNAQSPRRGTGTRRMHWVGMLPIYQGIIPSPEYQSLSRMVEMMIPFPLRRRFPAGRISQARMLPSLTMNTIRAIN